MAVGIRQALEQVILLPDRRHERLFNLVRGHGRHVAANHVNVFAIRAEHEAVRAVFAPGAQGHDVFVLVKLVIAVGVGETMHAGSAAAVDVHPQ